MAETADMVVIGGGLAGASVGAEAAVLGTGRVLLLEAESGLGQHTTGRSAAAYMPNYGNPAVRELTRRSLDTFRQMDEAEGEPVLTPRSALWVAGPGDAQEADVDAMLRDPTFVGLRGLDTGAAVRACPALRPEMVGSAALDTSSSDIDVARVLQHFVRRLRSAGGGIRLSDRVTGLERGHNGNWIVSTGSGTVIDTSIVVNAAGAWCDSVAVLAGVAPAGIIPHRRTIAVCRPSGTVPDLGWPLVIDVQETWYFRPEGTQVLVSPADETPSDPCDARPEEVDVALAMERVNERTTFGLRSVQSCWAGLRSFTADRAPVVGYDPEAPGFFWFGGQGGYGIQMAPGLATLGARLLLGATDPADAGLIAALAPGDSRRRTPVA